MLSNSIAITESTLFCRYSGVTYTPFKLLNPSPICSELPLDGLCYVSLNNLRSIHRRIGIVSVGELRDTFCPTCRLAGAKSGAFSCAVFVYSDGQSRVVYTEPFNTKDLLKIYKHLEEGGVRVFA